MTDRNAWSIGAHFFDHVYATYDTEYDADSPQEALERIAALGYQEQMEARDAGDSEREAYWQGYLESYEQYEEDEATSEEEDDDLSAASRPWWKFW